MKTLKLFIVFVPLLTFLGCGGGGNEPVDVVSKQEEKIGKYEDSGLPNFTCDSDSTIFIGCDLAAFTYVHIDELLKYREDKTIITSFPRNPISSWWLRECKLGVFILWTIEYIRLEYIDSDLLSFGKYPSQEPLLKLRPGESAGIISDYDAEAYKIASDAYYTWWTSNKNKPLIEIMKIDPLENTEYMWH